MTTGLGLLAWIFMVKPAASDPSTIARLFVEGGIGNVDESSRLAAVASALAGARCVVLGTAGVPLR